MHVKCPCMGHGFLCQSPCVGPCCAWEGVVGHYIDRCIRLSMLFSTYALCGFHWKRFVQKLWRGSLITSAFFASWPVLSGQMRQWWLLSSRLVSWTSDSSYNSTESSLVTVEYQQSFVACDFLLCVAKLLIRHTRTHAWSCSMLHHRVQSHN